MKSSTFSFKDHDGIDIFVYKWAPDGEVKAVLQIAHGMVEHGARYARPAEKFTQAGYVVYLNDHRGHNKTAKDLDKKGQLGPGGWESMVKDLKQLTDIIKKENPGLPVFLLGHSMGSFLAQEYIQQYGKELKGAILSGTNGFMSKLILALGKMMAKSDVKKLGPNALGVKMDNNFFGKYNKFFEPAKTKFDWLSRDEVEVKKYVDDPWCGFVCPTSFYVEFLTGLSTIWKKTNEARIPKDLPIYMYSGMLDPVGSNTKGVTKLFNRYKKLGIKDVTKKFYEGARHEMFNEINRDEVYKDVVQWLNAHI
ncbi:MAG: lysophospholipase [Promethearchaeota archaeon CR_4]|nr:MAG: lysophospholipase [Candidatus Lokiarchaeota archaeon CR_4]